MEKCIQYRGIWGYVGIDRGIWGHIAIEKGRYVGLYAGILWGNTWFRDWAHNHHLDVPKP